MIRPIRSHSLPPFWFLVHLREVHVWGGLEVTVIQRWREASTSSWWELEGGFFLLSWSNIPTRSQETLDYTPGRRPELEWPAESHPEF